MKFRLLQDKPQPKALISPPPVGTFEDLEYEFVRKINLAEARGLIFSITFKLKNEDNEVIDLTRDFIIDMGIDKETSSANITCVLLDGEGLEPELKDHILDRASKFAGWIMQSDFAFVKLPRK